MILTAEAQFFFVKADSIHPCLIFVLWYYY